MFRIWLEIWATTKIIGLSIFVVILLAILVTGIAYSMRRLVDRIQSRLYRADSMKWTKKRR